MNRIIVSMSVCTLAVVVGAHLLPGRAAPLEYGEEFGECRAQAFEHHESCLRWYTAREAECADALEREMRICRDVFPPTAANHTAR